MFFAEQIQDHMLLLTKITPVVPERSLSEFQVIGDITPIEKYMLRKCPSKGREDFV